LHYLFKYLQKKYIKQNGAEIQATTTMEKKLRDNNKERDRFGVSVVVALGYEMLKSKKATGGLWYINFSQNHCLTHAKNLK